MLVTSCEKCGEGFGGLVIARATNELGRRPSLLLPNIAPKRSDTWPGYFTSAKQEAVRVPADREAEIGARPADWVAFNGHVRFSLQSDHGQLAARGFLSLSLYRHGKHGPYCLASLRISAEYSATCGCGNGVGMHAVSFLARPPTPDTRAQVEIASDNRLRSTLHGQLAIDQPRVAAARFAASQHRESLVADVAASLELQLAAEDGHNPKPASVAGRAKLDLTDARDPRLVVGPQTWTDDESPLERTTRLLRAGPVRARVWPRAGALVTIRSAGMVVGGFGYRARAITLDPIFVTDHAREPRYPPPGTEHMFRAGLVGAREVWAKAGLVIRALPPRFMDISEFSAADQAALREVGGLDINRRESALPEPVEQALLNQDQEDNVFRIFYFRSNNFGGGGTTLGTGGRRACILTTIQNTDFDGAHKYHIAHELGHVLGFRHPMPAEDERGNRLPPPPGTEYGSGYTILCGTVRGQVHNATRSKNSIFHALNLKNVVEEIAETAFPEPDCCDDDRNRPHCPMPVPCSGIPGNNPPDCV